MQCRSCGTALQPGATTCPTCGMPTPYNVPGQAFQSSSPPMDYGGGSSPQYDPTVFVVPSGSSPQYAGPSQYDPTVAASPYYGIPSGGQGTPPTTYGSQPYGPPPANPYETPQQGRDQPGPYYGGPSPAPQNLYSNPYAPPPPAQAPSYSQSPGGFMPQLGQPPRPQGNKTGLILGIIALVIVLIGAGIFGVLALTGKNKQAQGGPIATTTVTTNVPTDTPTSAPTATPAQSVSPSGSPIDGTASSIITTLQTASGVDSNARPTQRSSSFAGQQTIYATFNLSLQGQTGYAEAKWYADGRLVLTSDILNVNDPNAPDGYIAAKYNVATQNGSVELYWCTQSNCSDAALAAVVNFTVS